MRFEPTLQERGNRQQLEGSIGLVVSRRLAKRSGIKTRLDMSRDFGRLPRNVKLVPTSVLDFSRKEGYNARIGLQ